MTTRIPLGLSVPDAELYEHLATHAERETSMMERYEAIARERRGYIGFLTGLIAEDEERHHRLYDAWAASLAAAAEARLDDPTSLGPEDDADELLESIEALLEFERRDLVQLKSIARSIRDVRDGSIWGLVLDVMRADTDKHIRILTFIREQLRADAAR